jgi:hypothetical protein
MASTLGLASTSVDLAKHVGHKVTVKGVPSDTMAELLAQPPSIEQVDVLAAKLSN